MTHITAILASALLMVTTTSALARSNQSEQLLYEQEVSGAARGGVPVSAFDKQKSAFAPQEGNPLSAFDKRRSAFADKEGRPRSAFDSQKGAFVRKPKAEPVAQAAGGEAAAVDWERKKFHGEPYVNGTKPSSEHKRARADTKGSSDIEASDRDHR
jgi:hypothetical protein